MLNYPNLIHPDELEIYSSGNISETRPEYPATAVVSEMEVIITPTKNGVIFGIVMNIKPTQVITIPMIIHILLLPCDCVN